MNKTLTKVALRYHAVFLDINREDINKNSEATIPVMAFVARLKENGFSVSEELLHALNAVSADTLAEITECINDVMGVNLNWASLVKGWDVPTGESRADHLDHKYFWRESGRIQGNNPEMWPLYTKRNIPVRALQWLSILRDTVRDSGLCL